MRRTSLPRGFFGALAVVSGAVVSIVTVGANARETTVPEGLTTVEIKSEHLTGTLPNGVVVDVNVKASAQGTDSSSLTGDGRHFASTGAHNYWPATGSTDGIVATLSGAVTDSNAGFLIGSPVEVVGDASTGAITLTFGPLAGGPFVGRTLVFTGTGRVAIATGDD